MSVGEDHSDSGDHSQAMFGSQISEKPPDLTEKKDKVQHETQQNMANLETQEGILDSVQKEVVIAKV